MEIYGQNSVVSEYPPKDTKSLWVDKGQLKMFINGKWQNVGGGDASNEDSNKPSGIKYTGHADVEGLKAIGWTDEDIAYYQENGVNWNEEDDEYHKVSDDNKSLYGVLTINNIQTYKDRIVYLPKIATSPLRNLSNIFKKCYSLVSIPLLDTSNITNMSSMFYECHSLVTIPQLDTSKVGDMSSMFSGCHSLVSIPQLNTSNVRGYDGMSNMFYGCYSLANIPQLDTSNVQSMTSMFEKCYSLKNIPQLNTNKVVYMSNMFSKCYSLVGIPQLDTSNVQSMDSMFYECHSLVNVPQLDISSGTDVANIFTVCYSLIHAKLKGCTTSIFSLYSSPLLSKNSLLYLINNEATTSTITITLASYAYERLANDTDVVAALANHPNITLAKS